MLDGPQLHGAHARLYWNLIWHCSRVSLPVPLARCFAPLHPRSDATDGGFAHGQALPISVIVTSSRARAFEWAARFRSRTTGPPRSALSCVRGMGESEGALYQSEEDRDFEAAGLAAVLSALCSPVRPVEQAVTCFLSLRKDARARKGRAQGVPNASSVSVFERPMYLVLLRIVQVSDHICCVAEHTHQLPRLQPCGTMLITFSSALPLPRHLVFTALPYLFCRALIS